MSQTDYYKILGVPNTATPAEIKSRYFELSKKVHPDRGGDDGLMALINEAYEKLSDDTLRKQYDAQSAADVHPQAAYEPPKSRPQSAYSSSRQYGRAKEDYTRQTRGSSDRQPPPRNPQLSPKDQKRLAAIEEQFKKTERAAKHHFGYWIFGAFGGLMLIAASGSQYVNFTTWALWTVVLWLVGSYLYQQMLQAALRNLKKKEAILRARAR